MPVVEARWEGDVSLIYPDRVEAAILLYLDPDPLLEAKRRGSGVVRRGFVSVGLELKHPTWAPLRVSYVTRRGERLVIGEPTLSPDSTGASVQRYLDPSTELVPGGVQCVVVELGPPRVELWADLYVSVYMYYSFT